MEAVGVKDSNCRGEEDKWMASEGEVMVIGTGEAEMSGGGRTTSDIVTY